MCMFAVLCNVIHGQPIGSFSIWKGDRSPFGSPRMFFTSAEGTGRVHLGCYAGCASRVEHARHDMIDAGSTTAYGSSQGDGRCPV